MAKFVVEHQEEILTFPKDTILELKIEEVSLKDVPSRSGDGQGWTKIEFVFKILGIQAVGDGGNVNDYDNWITRKIYGSVPAKLTDNPENRLRIWAEAIFKQELGIGFELDTDMFEGRTVRGLTSTYETKGRDGKGNPLKRHQIETLLPFGAMTSAPAGQPVAPVAAADPWATTPQPATAGAPWGQPASDEPPF